MVIDPGSNNTAHETANKAKCAANLHQIGLAIALYAERHEGQYPDSFETLLISEHISAAVFVCPSSKDIAATGPTTAETEADMALPHHVSYIYLGKGIHVADVKPGWVIAFEYPEDHDHQGRNMLFGDGHAEWFDEKTAMALIAKATTQTAAP